MPHNKKTLIFTATFNEVENIGKLISNIKKFYPSGHILIVDDNSPDGTGKKIKILQKKIKNLNFISRNKKSGLDSAHKLAYRFAKNKKFEYLITMDADLSHDPKVLKKFIKNLSNFAFCIGSRYIKGGKCLMKGRRLLISKYGNLVIKKILGIQLSEFTTSYRGFNLKKLKGFELNSVQTKGYSFFMGTIFEIYKRGYDIKEIPIIFKDRTQGVSKIPRLEILRTLKNLVILFFKRKW